MTVLVLGGVIAAYFSWEAYENRRLKRDQAHKNFLDAIEELKKDPP